MKPWEPVYDADGITLFHGDCMEVMPFLAGPFDMVLADLPYGTTRNQWDRELSNKLLWANYHALIRPRTPVVLFGVGMFSAKLMVYNEAEYRYTMIWDKQAITGHLNSKKQPLRAHEDMLVFYRQQPTYHPQMMDTGRRTHSRGRGGSRTINHWGGFVDLPAPEDQEGQYPRSIVSFKRPKGGRHPNQKPVALCEWLIRTFTNPDDLILDNVVGSGTTLVAARNAGRRAVGVELREDYCQDVIDRLGSGAVDDHWKARREGTMFG